MLVLFGFQIVSRPHELSFLFVVSVGERLRGSKSALNCFVN
jgi:hypothetical protein